MLSIYFMPSIILVCSAFFEQTHFLLEYTTIYFLGLTTAMIMLYQTLAVKFIKEIYKHHRLAFHSHIGPILGLFMATWISLSFIWLVQASIIASEVCMAD